MFSKTGWSIEFCAEFAEEEWRERFKNMLKSFDALAESWGTLAISP